MHAIGDAEDALELVRHEDDREPEGLRERQDQLVEIGRHHGIEAGRRLVEEDELGLERERAGDRGALLHAAGELGGELVGGAVEADELQLRARDRGDRVVREIGPLLERQRDVLADGQRAEERAGLEHDAERRKTGLEIGEAAAGDVDLAADGLLEPDQEAEQRRLAAAAAAEDREHLAALDRRRSGPPGGRRRPSRW